jgi:hypothetical protein
MRARALLLVAILSAGLLSVFFATIACEDAVTDSGVKGEVRIGPINPVEQPGVDNTAPYSARLTVRSVPEDNVVAETVSDGDGLFLIYLPPGDYVLVPENGDPLPIAESQAFTVSPGRFTTVDVAYDSGIR